MEKTVKTFKDLKVWGKAHELVLSIYEVTSVFPADERFGLTSQLRRSGISIPTNIVEGHKRKSRKDYLHFLNIADSSLEETKYHLLLAKDLRFMDAETHNKLLAQCEEVGRMLCGLQKGLIA